MVDLTNSRARASDVTTIANRKGVQRPAFARSSQNVAVVIALLDTLPTPSVDEVDKVYYQLKDILGIATA
jgi:hypothetical protein